MLSFENFVKSMPPSLSELKVTSSFCFAFKIPADVTASIIHIIKLFLRLLPLVNNCVGYLQDAEAQLILCLVASELSLPVSVQFCCIFAVTKDKFGSFLKKLLITSIRS